MNPARLPLSVLAARFRRPPAAAAPPAPPHAASDPARLPSRRPLGRLFAPRPARPLVDVHASTAAEIAPHATRTQETV